MVFQVPKSKASFKQNVFEFQIDGNDKVWSIPLVRYLNADLMTRMQAITGPLKKVIESGGSPSDEEASMLANVQREIVEHYCPGLYRLADLDQIAAILQAWRDASNPNGADVDLGESSPSA